MHLVLKNLSPEDLKKYNKRRHHLRFCKWSEKYKKEKQRTKKGGIACILQWFSRLTKKVKWALSNIYRNFGWDWMISGSDQKFLHHALAPILQRNKYPCIRSSTDLCACSKATRTFSKRNIAYLIIKWTLCAKPSKT